ncbi:uncharacterized protein [Amphiura filiformis]|uniref:uncharacterized protein n=1 Tax=Amphiura filiformis TaxID=82378 RepID=UPI003B218FEB
MSSKRKAAQAARQNIREQLIDGPHITEYSEKTSFNLHRVKVEPEYDDEEPQFSWRHSPIPDEEEVEENTAETGDVGDGIKDSEATGVCSTKPTSSTSAIQKSYTPIVPVKIKQPSSSPALQKAGLASVPTKSPDKTVNPPKKQKTNIPIAPANMKVKVIRACPKCTPIVMELAEQANKASKNSQELKRLMEDATQNVEKVKVILEDTFKKNRGLEERLAECQDSSFSFPKRVLTCDTLMHKFSGVHMCNQFKWLVDKASQRLTRADTTTLKVIKLNYTEQVLAVLMFLRTNQSLDELSFSFSYLFTEDSFWEMLSVWLVALVAELKPRISKPPNCILNTNFPMCFQSMGRNLQAIIHKFDIVREKPAIFDAWQTSHCLKCIVTMSPKGSVMGVSQVVDQTVPDTDLFTFSEQDKLFCVSNIVIDTQALGLTQVLPFGVKVVEPPFDKELEEEAVHHIERIMKKLLEFRILQGPIARTITKSMMDMIVIVCCGVLNMHEEANSYEPSKIPASSTPFWPGHNLELNHDYKIATGLIS